MEGASEILARMPFYVAENSKICLNIHRNDDPYFEWHRIIKQGAARGAVVVTEDCLPTPLYRNGIHFLTETPRHMPHLINWLLDTPRIDLIEGGVDIGTRRVLVRSLVPNAQSALRPGMLARTRLFFSHPVAGQVIPTSALQTIAGQKCVFVQTGPDHYAARHVVVGPSLDGRTVLTQGVEAGEIVVTHGSFILKSQALLNPTPQSGQVEK